jgi:hypothetical protein
LSAAYFRFLVKLWCNRVEFIKNKLEKSIVHSLKLKGIKSAATGANWADNGRWIGGAAAEDVLYKMLYPVFKTSAVRNLLRTGSEESSCSLRIRVLRQGVSSGCRSYVLADLPR